MLSCKVLQYLVIQLHCFESYNTFPKQNQIVAPLTTNWYNLLKTLEQELTKMAFQTEIWGSNLLDSSTIAFLYYSPSLPHSGLMIWSQHMNTTKTLPPPLLSLCTFTVLVVYLFLTLLGLYSSAFLTVVISGD